MGWTHDAIRVASPLYLLLLLPFLFLLFRKGRRGGKSGVLLADARLLGSRMRFSRLLSIASSLFLLGSVCATVLALASPGVPKIVERPISSSQFPRDVVVVFDVSGSMTTKLDGGSSGFEFGRELITTFCEKRSRDRFALLVFSDQGPYFARSFTNDCEQLLAPLKGDINDSSSLISQFSSGTDIVEALASSVFLFEEEGSSGSKIVMLLSDLGHAGSVSDVVEAIAWLEKQGAKVYVLAINASSREFSAVSEYAKSSPHVRVFAIEAQSDLEMVSRALEALEPSSVSVVSTETITVNEANKELLGAALASLALWVLVQVLVRRVV